MGCKITYFNFIRKKNTTQNRHNKDKKMDISKKMPTFAENLQ